MMRILRRSLGSRFDHILVDEYQDTNPLQASILLPLKADGRGLTVVCDDAQSIYSFRAATVRNILDFPSHFMPQARIVTLERNYRSTQPILAASNAVIALAAERFSKNLWSSREASARPLLVAVRDEADQARYVVQRVLENREAGLALKSQAVLFRTSHHSDTLEFELTRRNIPFVKFGGLKFLEAAHVKDVLAALRFAENPRDQFFNDLTLDPPSATSDEAGAPLLDEDYLILSTIHSAKGQEWKSVFVLNAVDGCIPSDLATGNADEIEEERRLLYVAMTRAKDQLDVMVPQRFYTHNQANRGDRYVHALRTRFIPTSVARYFEQRVWPSARQATAAAQPSAQMDVTARMRAMGR